MIGYTLLYLTSYLATAARVYIPAVVFAVFTFLVPLANLAPATVRFAERWLPRFRPPVTFSVARLLVHLWTELIVHGKAVRLLALIGSLLVLHGGFVGYMSLDEDLMTGNTVVNTDFIPTSALTCHASRFYNVRDAIASLCCSFLINPCITVPLQPLKYNSKR